MYIQIIKFGSASLNAFIFQRFLVSFHPLVQNGDSVIASTTWVFGAMVSVIAGLTLFVIVPILRLVDKV
jgi:hypothetical protein